MFRSTYSIPYSSRIGATCLMTLIAFCLISGSCLGSFSHEICHIVYIFCANSFFYTALYNRPCNLLAKSKFPKKPLGGLLSLPRSVAWPVATQIPSYKQIPVDMSLPLETFHITDHTTRARVNLLTVSETRWACVLLYEGGFASRVYRGS